MLMIMQIITIRGSFLEMSMARWCLRKCKSFEDIDNVALVWKSLMSLNSVYSYFIYFFGKESIIDILWVLLTKRNIPLPLSGYMELF